MNLSLSQTFCSQTFSGLNFTTFGLNTESCTVSLHIQSECGKILIFLQTKIKNPRKFQSDDSRMKVDMTSCFSSLTQKINLSYLLWKPEFPKCTFSSRTYFVNIFHKQKKETKLCKSTVVKKTWNAYSCFPETLSISELRKVRAKKLVIRLSFCQM